MIYHFKSALGDFAIEVSKGRLVGTRNLAVALQALAEAGEVGPEIDQPSPVPQRSVSEGEVIPFFGFGPCWFDGCEKLREEYRREKDDMTKKAEEQGGQCSDCDLAALQAKYRRLVKDALARI